MSKVRKLPPPIGRRVYQTDAKFQLTALERLRALLGGIVHVKVSIIVAPKSASIPTEIIKRVDWPWS